MKHKQVKGNIINTEKPNLYCRKKGGIIDYSKVVLRIENSYGEGSYNETLNVMRKQLLSIRNEIESRIKSVEETLSGLNQQKLF